jgi:cell division protein FtsI (penicillin-binding protein 3)
VSVALVLVALVAALVVRLVFLQAYGVDGNAQFLQKQGDLRAVRAAEVPAYRGVITDRWGDPLAVSTPVVTLIADPQLLTETAHVTRLAQALEWPVDRLQARLRQYADRRYMRLVKNLTPDRARKILALGIPGVEGERQYQRFYPAGEVMAHVLGLTDVQGAGLSGVEKAFDTTLQGAPGKKLFIKDLHGDMIRDIGIVEQARPGQSIALSIDLRLQYLQHRELQRAMAETGAEAGAAVTIDAWTGEILAMTNHPVFNPNNRAAIEPATTRNRVVTDTFEPGSTMKPLTLVAALESGEFTLDTVIDTSPGRIRVGRKVLPDPLNYGEITVSRVIEKSSQVGVTKIAQQLGYEPILDVFRRFGLGDSSALGYPGERSGYLPQRDRWSEIEEVTLAFGYGLTATPLQIAHAYTVFANKGRQAPLTLLKREVDDVIPQRQVVSPGVAAQVLTVLHRVTGEHGTGKKARVPGFDIGGKTGTVHKVGASGYLDDQYIALFVGVAPVSAPRYVTAVVVDQPKGDNYGGGAAAAPIYAKITEGVLRLRNAVPTLMPEEHVASLGGGQ